MGSEVEHILLTSYLDFAQHYGTVLVPARPRSPKDKSEVEVVVQVAERWILACLRHVTCFSLAELNQHIGWLPDGVRHAETARPLRTGASDPGLHRDA